MTQYNWYALLSQSMNDGKNKFAQLNDKRLSAEDKRIKLLQVRSELMFALDCSGHLLKEYETECGIG